MVIPVGTVIPTDVTVPPPPLPPVADRTPVLLSMDRPEPTLTPPKVLAEATGKV
jgi:hypothetical protein